jgi:ApaG protein
MSRLPRSPAAPSFRDTRRARDRAIYEATTRSILVRVEPRFQPERSDESERRFVWSYTVEIENHGEETVQLLTRRWLITDGLNRTETYVGDGVVGEQPTLKPREAFRYTSVCPLSTPTGEMRGAYQMATEDGQAFEIEVPAFSLHMPSARRLLN